MRPKRFVLFDTFLFRKRHIRESKSSRQKGQSLIIKMRQKTGFTLIELIVVMAVMAILSAIFLASYRGGQKEYTLLGAVQLLVSDLRRTQNLAVTRLEQNGIAPYGYGVYVRDAQTYLIFYNLAGDKNYQADSKVLETIILPKQVSINPTNKSVFFTPPDPTTYIDGLNVGSQSFTLIMAGRTKSVTVYSSGRIEQ